MLNGKYYICEILSLVVSNWKTLASRIRSWIQEFDRALFAKQPYTNPIKHQSCHHLETSELICSTNQLPGFYMMTTLEFNALCMIILCACI